MNRLLENKVCLITGAGRGIGRAIAERFASDGAVVYVNDLTPGDMDSWAADCASRNGARVVPVCFDVTDSSAVKAGLMSVYKEEGRIDCVVNNAAIISNKKLGMIVKSDMERMFSVNVLAVIDMIQTASRLMARGGGGCFVNIASITGVVGSPGQVAYSATKGAVISLTKSAAKELAPQHIRVNAVAPGIVRTERFDELYLSDGGKIDSRIEKIALGRLGTPEDVARTWPTPAPSWPRTAPPTSPARYWA